MVVADPKVVADPMVNADEATGAAPMVVADPKVVSDPTVMADEAGGPVPVSIDAGLPAAADVIGPEKFSETQGVAVVRRRVVSQVGVNELLELKLCMGPGYTPWANILQKHSCRSRICDCRSCPCECSRDRVFRVASPLSHRLFITVFCCSVGTNVATTVATNSSAFSC